MTLTRINIVLAILLAITATLAVTVHVDHSQPNVEFLSEMNRSPASDAFAASAAFPNGRTLQSPVLGTIARGDLPLYYEATKEDAARAGEELHNPFNVPSDILQDDESKLASQAKRDASIQRGAKAYGIYCVSCHGPTGAGDGPVAKRGFPPPPPLTTGKSVQMKDGQLFHILTYGQGSMSSMAPQLDRDRRWDVINYIRSLQQGAANSPPATSDKTTPAAEPNTDQPEGTQNADEGRP